MKAVSEGDVRAAEQEAINAFIRRERRERWLNALDSPTRRHKTVRLHDTRDFDERWGRPVTGADDSSERVAALLRSLGAPDSCLLMEEIPAPTRSLSLVEALHVVYDEDQWGSLIICIPGVLAFQKLEYPDGGVVYQR